MVYKECGIVGNEPSRYACTCAGCNSSGALATPVELEHEIRLWLRGLSGGGGCLCGGGGGAFGAAKVTGSDRCHSEDFVRDE